MARLLAVLSPPAVALSAAAFAACVGACPDRATAQMTTISISMAAPPASPRIGGAPILGVRPGAPLVHTIAATGTRPMTFAASGLPPGVALDAATGRLSGMIAAAGTHAVSVTATNGAGSDTRALRIVAGDTLALTPPMGWNSYDSFDDSVREAEVLEQARWQRDNLLPFGWDTVVVDFRWYDPNAPNSDQNQAAVNTSLVTDSSGRMLPAPGRFPSATGDTGFRTLADMIHGMGLKFGIHIMRGIPRKSVQADTPIMGSSFTARDAANMQSVCPWNSDMYGVTGQAGQAWYDSIFQQYASWGIDFVKVDDATFNRSPIEYHAEEVGFIASAIARSGRSIVLSLSPGETPVSAAANLRVNANMWRMSDDFWDRWSALGDTAGASSSFALGERWSRTDTGPAGHWPDADMLPLGRLGPRCPVDGANRTTRFTRNEQVLMMSLWALLPSPLMLGANMVQSNDTFLDALLRNEEMLAINQDALGAKGRLVVRDGTREVWARDLADGRKAVGLFNRGNTDQSVTATFSQLGITGSVPVRNVWQRTDLGVMTGSLASSVPYHGAVLLIVGTPPAGDGGADAGADAAGDGPVTGMDAATGGRGGGAGSGGGGGSGGSGGSSAGTGGGRGTGGGAGGAGNGGSGAGTGGGSGGSGAGTGGGSGSGGAPAGMGGSGGGGGAPSSTGGRGGSTVTPATGGAGCSCATAGAAPGSPVLAAGMLLVAAATRLRRRRRLGQGGGGSTPHTGTQSGTEEVPTFW